MNAVLGHDSALVRLYWAGVNLGNEMNFVMNCTPGAGSLAQPVDQQSSVLRLYHGCPLVIIYEQGGVTQLTCKSWFMDSACCSNSSRGGSGWGL